MCSWLHGGWTGYDNTSPIWTFGCRCLIQTEILLKINPLAGFAWHTHEAQCVGSLFLLLPEYWLSSVQLQHGGSCLWSLALWTLSHFHFFLLWGESILAFLSSSRIAQSFFSLPSLLSPLIIFLSFLLFSSLLPHSVCIFVSGVLSQTLDDDPVPTNNNNQWQSRPILEWNNQQVCLWLITMNMDQYASEFAARGVDGTQLLSLDGEKLKVSRLDEAERNKII